MTFMGWLHVFTCMLCFVCCVGEWWWSPLLEELQEEGSSVQADSWSLVVEPSFLQTLHKDLIKQQDVIYGNKYIYTHKCKYIHSQHFIRNT